MEHVDENKEIVNRLINEFVNEGDEAVADELLAPDYVRYDPDAPSGAQGPEEFKEMIQMFGEAFPDAEVAIEEMIGEGDLVVFRGTETGTHEGEFMGHEPTGQTFEISGLAMHRVEDGEITQTWANWDMLGMMQQLGVVPMPDDLIEMTE
ncbi:MULTISPECIES: ester cyclase [unclassified Haladaptatus]|uniref:ester cyclase n=1 Tax=unclassified Haladaptatus TaxID=2622732 RepID=UPI00209BCC01|nr:MULTISPECIES: ester cyclase [unclassified Haladaptatus]MCO8246516.1 ester cyclase [Haladaptatus sp. AB643]MCO8254754.1 ester cyclase [Haladaptatus sp. AB618]